MGQTRSQIGRTLGLSLLAAGISLSGAALAAPESVQRTPPSAAAASISQDELKTFAVAAVEVKKINDTYRPRYQAAKTPEAKQDVQKEAQEKMATAVESKGLSVDKYNQIVRVAQADPQVAKQIDDYVRDAQ